MFERKRDVGIDTTIKDMRAVFNEEVVNRFAAEEPTLNRLLSWMLAALWLLAGGAIFAVLFFWI